MTNETAAAGLAGKFSCELNQQLGQGQELWHQILAWFTDRGLAFAMNVLAALVILLLGAIAIRLIVAAIGKAVEKGGRKRSLLANFARNATAKVCWAILVVIVLGRLGVNVGPIVAGLGVTGFILGFAFQESLGNLASGLMIAINEPFKIGDYVIIAGLEGSVTKVDMMATELATADNKKIVIPNKSAWGAPITNYSALGRRRVDLKVGIDYNSDLSKALRLALDTVSAVPGVLKDPAPTVSLATLGTSEITLNVRPWAEGADYWSVHSETQVALKQAFDRNGIDIPYPQLTVHMKG